MYFQPVSFEIIWLKENATGENEFSTLRMMFETQSGNKQACIEADKLLKSCRASCTSLSF